MICRKACLSIITQSQSRCQEEPKINIKGWRNNTSASCFIAVLLWRLSNVTYDRYLAYHVAHAALLVMIAYACACARAHMFPHEYSHALFSCEALRVHYGCQSITHAPHTRVCQVGCDPYCIYYLACIINAQVTWNGLFSSLSQTKTSSWSFQLCTTVQCVSSLTSIH